MVMKSFGVSKTRNFEKSEASNARPSQTPSGKSGSSGSGNRGTVRKDNFSIGKVRTK